MRVMRSDVLDANHDLVTHVVRAALRPARAIDVLRDDHRAVTADLELRAMCGDTQALDEAEYSAQQFRGLAHVGIRQNGDHGWGRDGAVGAHVAIVAIIRAMASAWSVLVVVAVCDAGPS